MLNMTREEFMDMALKIENERVKEFLKDKNEPELSLLFLLFGFDVVRKIADEIYGEENNEK